MKNVVLSAILTALVGLTGCGSDNKPANNIPAPAPEDSGIKGPPPKGKTGDEVPAGGRTIPGGKK